MSDLQRIAVGVRRPQGEGIEYAFLKARNPENLLPVLRQQYSLAPRKFFAELAADRRMFQAGDGVEFHRSLRQADATHWHLFQVERWEGAESLPARRESLLTRWHGYSREFGGDRFLPRRNGLGGGEGGIKRNCIMGMAVELFLDDYPGAIAVVDEPLPALPGGMPNALPDYRIHYVTFNPADRPGLLPAVVQRELGLSDERGTFVPDDRVCHILENAYGMPMGELRPDLDWNLVHLNDVAPNWPLSAALMDLPAPGLFVR